MSERLPLIHPGEILEEEFLKPMAISQYRSNDAIDHATYEEVFTIEHTEHTKK